MRRLSGSTDWFAFSSLAGAPSATAPHTLFVVCATPTLPSATAEYRAINCDTGVQNLAIGIRINDAGGVLFTHKNAAGSTVYSHTQGSVFSASSAPHALALVYDGTNCVAYVDGTQVNSAAPGSLGALGTFTSCGTQTDHNAGTSFDVGHMMLFSQALTAAQIRTLGNARAPLGIASANVQGWWALRGGAPLKDLSRYKNDLTVGGSTLGAGAPDEKRATDMRRAKVFLPQYMLQPPIVLTAGARTNAPNVSLTSSAAVACTAGASSNCPAATITASAPVTSTAATVSNSTAAVSAGAPVAATAPTTTNVPAVTLLNAPAVASTAGAVSNAPSATLSPNYPVISTAVASSNCPAANVTCSAPVASVASSTSDVPAASIAGGLGATASSVSDAPAVTLQRDLPIVSVAGSVSNAPAAVGAGASVAATAASVSNATTASLTSSGAVSSAANTTSNAPSAAVSAGAVVAITASTASNCPSAVISSVRQVAAVSGSTSNCPAADVVVALFPPVAAFGCMSRSDCPPVYLFQSITIPQVRRQREWPPRLR